MKCPNCNKEMKDKGYRAYYLGLGGIDSDEEDDYDWHEKFYCHNCRITYEDDRWKIPIKEQPTNKQVKTILFINNRLGTIYKAITKSQCWKIINENFDKAKKTEPRHWYDDVTEEDCDFLGLDESMFY